MAAIKQIRSEPDTFRLPLWDELINYPQNSMVAYYDSEFSGRNRYFISHLGAPSGAIPIESSAWKEFTNDSDILSAVVNEIFKANLDGFNQYLSDKLDSEAADLLEIVDSELRELREDVNESLINNIIKVQAIIDSDLNVSLNHIDSEILKVRTKFDSEILVINTHFNDKIDSEILIIENKFDSELLIKSSEIRNLSIRLDSDSDKINNLSLSVSNNYTYVNNRIDSVQQEVDSDSSQVSSLKGQVLSYVTKINEFDSEIQNIDSKFLLLQQTDVSIYKDIQSNRDRIIVLENDFDSSVSDFNSAQTVVNDNFTGLINGLTSRVDGHDAEFVSVYNDVADLRATISNVDAILGIDSDWIDRQLDKVKMAADSEWIIETFSDRLQTDSDWIIRNTIQIYDSDDKVLVRDAVKEDLDFGTF